jgi:hypothetical protein
VDINDPNHFVQAIAVYGRSDCLPSEPNEEVSYRTILDETGRNVELIMELKLLNRIQSCTNFVFDMLYIHEKKSEVNCPQVCGLYFLNLAKN